MIDVKNILELATLPAQINNATAIGSAESAIITTVAEQLKDSFAKSGKTTDIKSERELLSLYKEECAVFGEKPSRDGYTAWKNTRTV